VPGQVGNLAGPYIAAALLLVLGGVFKAVSPEPTARALTGAGLRLMAPLARPLGLAEVAVGVAALATSSRIAAGLVAAFYVSFAVFVVLRLTRPGTAGGCGCFGESEGPPTPVHAVLNLAAAGVAGAVAAGSGGGLGAALRDQPLAGLPMLALALLVTALAYAVLTVLPRTLTQLEAVRQ
jgi:hypothetical protein